MEHSVSDGKKAFSKNKKYLLLQHCIIPTLFMTLLPIVGILLLLHPRPDGISGFQLSIFLGNRFTWTFILIFLTWAVIFLKIPSKQFYGPVSDTGYQPNYSTNGFTYYYCTLFVFIRLVWTRPSIARSIMDNLPEMIGSLSLMAFGLCIYLWLKGKSVSHRGSYEQLNEDNLPAIFEFYSGVEQFPRIMDINVKQLTNSRVGIMLWQLFVVSAFVAGRRPGELTNPGALVNVLLQSIYLAKFYWWETGYFTTLDFTLDRAGFYMCWGCLAFMPMLMPYSAYYFAINPPTPMSSGAAATLLTVGVIFIYFNYAVDHQKELFRATDGKCQIWGRTAEYVDAKYTAIDGTVKNSKLLTSGYWGLARHSNYLFDFLAGLLWNLPGWHLGLMPFLYNIFLFVLLVHRLFRDEQKCSKKYGHFWKKYCDKVKYRLVPYVY